MKDNYNHDHQPLIAMSLLSGTSKLGMTSAINTNIIKSSRISHQESHAFKQEAFRAGLLVTEQLEKAISRCREKVQSFAEECRSENVKFRFVYRLYIIYQSYVLSDGIIRDLEFDLKNNENQCLYSVSQ